MTLGGAFSSETADLCDLDGRFWLVKVNEC